MPMAVIVRSLMLQYTSEWIDPLYQMSKALVVQYSGKNSLKLSSKKEIFIDWMSLYSIKMHANSMHKNFECVSPFRYCCY